MNICTFIFYNQDLMHTLIIADSLLKLYFHPICFPNPLDLPYTTQHMTTSCKNDGQWKLNGKQKFS